MKRWVLISVCCLVVLLIGFLGYFSSSYGRANKPLEVNDDFAGCYNYRSIRGFGLFADLIRKRNGTVRRKSVVSPSLSKNDVIIWAHKGPEMPSYEVFEMVRKYADEGGATIWFFHNDWDNGVAFRKKLYENSPSESSEAARYYYNLRRSEVFEESPTLYQMPTFPGAFAKLPLQGQSPWFSIKPSKRFLPKVWERVQDGQSIVSLRQASIDDLYPADGADKDTVAVSYTGSFLVPKKGLEFGGVNEGELEEPDELTIAELMAGKVPKAKDMTKIEAKPPSGMNFGISETIVGRTNVVLFSDPSFLSNFGILERSNKELVQQVADMLPRFSPQVCFLETGPNAVLISEDESVRKIRLWKWMGKGTIPLLIINAIVICVLYCMAKLPVFGRSSEFTFQNRADMSDHLAEVGRMLQSVEDSDTIDETIQHYFQVNRTSPIGKR